MCALTKDNFFIKFQEMLEKYYLQPLDGSIKENLKDGLIERVIHGAQHSSRTVLWAFITSKLLEKIVPEYTNVALAKIAQHLKLSEEQIPLLILMAMGCHDAARKGEGSDKWEFESAVIAFEYLKELGLTESQAKFFSYAIYYKDKNDNYSMELNKLGIAKDDHPFFAYIRILISLGDNLDIIRCVGNFKSSMIFATLRNISAFNDNHHDLVYELIKEVHQFIHDQHDMLFDCTILNSEAKPIISLKNNFSKKEKVAFEHAGNVLSAVFAEAAKNPMFMPFLNEFSLPESNKYDGNIAFDPFIHGTNSSILSILPKCEFKIMSPLEMMDDYQVVSMTGELTGGGYDSVGEDTVKDGIMGKTSFGILSTSDEEAYTLASIIKYTKPHSEDTIDHITSFCKSAVFGRDNVFWNINRLLIRFARARQVADSLDEIISNDDLTGLREQFEATRQYFYFLQLLGSYINPDFNAINKHGIKSHILAAVAQKQFTYTTIFDKILKNKINMEDIVNNPTPENLQKALSVLEFPENLTITHWLDKKEFILPIKQLFCIDPNTNYYSGYCDNEEFVKITTNYWPIENCLSEFLRGYKSGSYFKDLGEKTKQIIIGFNDRIRIFDKLIAAPQSHFKFTEQENFFLKERFPIILVCEDETHMSMHTFSKSEYRSSCGLRLGHDIKMLATDTHEHRLLIMKYLDLHNLSNVQVVLFDDLDKSRESKQRPDSPYHNKDNSQTLQWLSAKKIQFNDHSFFQSQPKFKGSMDDAMKLLILLKDGQEYQSINIPGSSL